MEPYENHHIYYWFRHIRASGSGVVSTPRTLKNLPWNPYCHFGAPNRENVTKMTPKLVPRGSQNPPKIDKNPDLDPKVSCGVSPGTPGSPKWSPRVPKWTPQASQITGLGTQSDPIQHPASPASPANPPSPASHQLTDYWRGLRQGRSLNKYTSSYFCVWCGIKCVTTGLHV